METENNSTQKVLSFTRRAFLKLGLSVSALASTWGIFKFLSYKAPEEKLLSIITLGKPRLYPLNSALYIREVRAWLIRDRDGFYAVSSTCTHLGCTINHGEGGKTFDCPCHGSKFNLSGRVLQGPATTALPVFEVRLSDDGRIVIDSRVIVPPTNRLVV